MGRLGGGWVRALADIHLLRLWPMLGQAAQARLAQFSRSIDIRKVVLVTGIVSVFTRLTCGIWQDPKAKGLAFLRAEDLPESPEGWSHI